jgi:hypothetical protein
VAGRCRGLGWGQLRPSRGRDCLCLGRLKREPGMDLIVAAVGGLDQRLHRTEALQCREELSPMATGLAVGV